MGRIGLLLFCVLVVACDGVPAVDDGDGTCLRGVCGPSVGELVVVDVTSSDNESYLTVEIEVVEFIPAVPPESPAPKWLIRTTVNTALAGLHVHEEWVGIPTDQNGDPRSQLETFERNGESPWYSSFEVDFSGMQLVVPGPQDRTTIEVRIPAPARVDRNNPYSMEFEVVYPAAEAHFSNRNEVHFGRGPEHLELEDGFWRLVGPLPNVHIGGDRRAPDSAMLSVRRSR